jgi:predicted phosphodiesterase
MRLWVLSDLHTEFGHPAPPPPPVAPDVIILAGDIGTNLSGFRAAEALAADAPVVYVAGNHEYYGQALPRLTDKLRGLSAASSSSGVHFLEDEQVVIGGVRFLGCTLWTDFGLLGPGRLAAAREAAGGAMTDYRRVRKSPEFRRLRPADTAAVHAASRRWLTARLAEAHDGPTVIVTHHAPSARSLRPGQPRGLIDAAYASDLDELVAGSGAALWVHGHTHLCVDYVLGRTRVLSNARGYPDEESEGFRADCVVEL